MEASLNLARPRKKQENDQNKRLTVMNGYTLILKVSDRLFFFLFSPLLFLFFFSSLDSLRELEELGDIG